MPPSRDKLASNGYKQIQGLEPCKHSRPLRSADVLQRLRTREDANCTLHTCGSQLKPHGDHAFSVQFPVGLAFSATASGLPDLRIELVRLRWGSTGDTSPWDHSPSTSRDIRPGPWVGYPWLCQRHGSNRPVHECDGRRRAIRAAADEGCDAWASAAAACRTRHYPHGRRGGYGCGGSVASTLGQYLSTASALLLFSVLHRDATAMAAPSLVLPGLAVVAAELVMVALKRISSSTRPPPPSTPPLPMKTMTTATTLAAAATGLGPEPEFERTGFKLGLGPKGSCNIRSYDLQGEALAGSKKTAGIGNLDAAGFEPAFSVVSESDWRAERGAAPPPPPPSRPSRGLRSLGRRFGSLVAGLRHVSGPASALLERILGTSALLSLASRAWRVVHASSAALAEAVADLTAVGLSYNCLARQAQLERLPPGRAQEMAWRRLHKAAARRLARHLGDLPEQPPLQPALTALQCCSIAAGIAVDGVPLCGALDGFAGGGDSSSSRRLRLSFSYGRSQRRRQQKAATRETAAMEATRLVTEPRGALVSAALEASSSGTAAAAASASGSRRGGGVFTLAAACPAPTVEVSPHAPAGTAVLDILRIPGCSPPTLPTPHQPRHASSGITSAVEWDQRDARPKPLPEALAAAWGPAPVWPSGNRDVTPLSPPEHAPELPQRASESLLGVRRWAASGWLARTAVATPPQPPSSTHATIGGAAAMAGEEKQHQQVAASSLSSSVGSRPVSSSPAARQGLPHAASVSSLQSLSASPPLLKDAILATAAAAPLSSDPGFSAAAAVAPAAAAPTNGGDRGSGNASLARRPRQRLANCIAHATAANSSLPCDSSSSWGNGLSCAAAAADAASGVAANGCGAPGARCRIALPAVASSTGRTDSCCGTLVWDNSVSTSNKSSSQDGSRPLLQPDRHRQQHQQPPQLLLAPQAPPPLAGAVAAQPGESRQLGMDGCSNDGGGGSSAWELLPLPRGQEAQLLRREQEQAEALGLPLYGRTDHVGGLQPHSHHRTMGLWELLGLAVRAAYLLIVFAPFLTFGVPLLLVAAMSVGQGRSRSARSVDGATAGSGAAADGGRAGGVAATAGGQLRGAVALGYRRCAWRLLLGGCRCSGAAFIKWAQWAATRTDLFPNDFCEVLSQLHDQAPRHSFAFTRRQVESAFGVPLDAMFEAFDPQPAASGSIAQVHRALLRCSDGPLDVAVKVVHPNVEQRIRQDFALLQPAAAALGHLPSLRFLSLPETVSQFSCTMTSQVDLRVEAAHLRRFYANFSRVSKQVTTPRPLPGLVRREVMVESWEAGRSVKDFIRQPSPVNTSIVCLGVDTYLKMLLQDNFVHTDLHPGNIMVRLVGRNGRPLPPALQGPPQTQQQQQQQAGQATAVAPLEGGRGQARARPAATAATASAAAAAAAAARVQLVLLDFGLAEELTPVVRHHFISFLHHILRGDGASAATHLLRWTSRPQSCPDPAAFVADMEALAAERCDVQSAAGVDLDVVMKSVLRLARKHAVTIDSCYASLVIAVCVIVGFATSLDPWVNLADAAVPAMLAHALTGRVMGRLYS